MWLSAAAAAQPPSFDDMEVSLVTVGPGAVYWQAFGHNAILVEDPVSGFSASYNFGLFDFTSENFLLNFIRGNMTYRMAAFEPEADIAGYIRDRRRVTLQKLNLSSDQKRRLLEHLEWHRRPENAAYAYDYFRQNCSTKVRDVLDLALDGALKRSFEREPSTETYRSSLSRYAATIPWLNFGANLALGRTVDQPVTTWDLFYLPDHLSAGVAQAAIAASPEAALVLETEVIHAGAAAGASWRTAVFLGLPAAALVLYLIWRLPVAAAGWALVSGLLGAVVLALWTGTRHWAAASNPMLLAFSPLLPLLAFTAVGRRWLAWVIAAGMVLALFVSDGAVQRTTVLFQLLAMVISAGRHWHPRELPTGQ